jgi:hypothetical protein
MKKGFWEAICLLRKIQYNTDNYLTKERQFFIVSIGSIILYCAQYNTTTYYIYTVYEKHYCYLLLSTALLQRNYIIVRLRDNLLIYNNITSFCLITAALLL